MIVKVILLAVFVEAGENVIEHEVSVSGCRPVIVLLIVAKLAPESGVKSKETVKLSTQEGFVRGFIDRNKGEVPSGILAVHVNDIVFDDDATQEQSVVGERELKHPVMAEVFVNENTVESKVIVAVPGVIPVAPNEIWKVY